MQNEEYLLKRVAATSTERGQSNVHMRTAAIDWATLGSSAAQRDAPLNAVCRFARHVRVDDTRHELPSPHHFDARKTHRTPDSLTLDGQRSLELLPATNQAAQHGLRFRSAGSGIAAARAGRRFLENWRASVRYQRVKP